jgi:hypothetical protein
MTLAPEIYSGLQEGSAASAVRFDPERALSAIRGASPEWATQLSGVQGIDQSDGLAAVPVLRYPHWVGEVPAAVRGLAGEGFDTVVRLPFDARFSKRLGRSEQDWVAAVRNALEDVSDQILLLLGCFSEVVVDDRLMGRREVVTPTWERAAEDHGHVTREVVRILRNGAPSSQWQLFRRTLPEHEDLAGEIAVGIRFGGGPGPSAVLPADDHHASAPFHLFFPTRIPSARRRRLGAGPGRRRGGRRGRRRGRRG